MNLKKNLSYSVTYWCDNVLWSSIYWLYCYLVVHTQDPGNTQTPTAFTKGQTANLHLTKGEKIPFNKRITEFGANFDADGSFVCQTPGLYAFTFYGLTEQNWELWLEMMKNDQLIASGELSERCETITSTFITCVLSFKLSLWLHVVYLFQFMHTHMLTTLMPEMPPFCIWMSVTKFTWRPTTTTTKPYLDRETRFTLLSLGNFCMRIMSARIILASPLHTKLVLFKWRRNK